MENNKPQKFDLRVYRDVQDESIGSGLDSMVHSVNNQKKGRMFVEKKYYGHIYKEVLEKYYNDTEKAQKLLLTNPNPLGQTLLIDKQDFTLQYEIIPQGGISSEPEEETLVSCYGQKYVPGLNLESLFSLYYDRDPNENETNIKSEKLLKNQEGLLRLEILDGISDLTKKLFDYLSKKLAREFSFANVNVKPFLNTEEKSIKVCITDLAAHII